MPLFGLVMLPSTPAWISDSFSGNDGAFHPSMPTHSATCSVQVAALVIVGTVKVPSIWSYGPALTA